MYKANSKYVGNREAKRVLTGDKMSQKSIEGASRIRTLKGRGDPSTVK